MLQNMSKSYYLIQSTKFSSTDFFPAPLTPDFESIIICPELMIFFLAKVSKELKLMLDSNQG